VGGVLHGVFAGVGACCGVVLLLISDKTYPGVVFLRLFLGFAMVGFDDLRSAAVGLVDAKRSRWSADVFKNKGARGYNGGRVFGATVGIL
jgi:hypothetical protein